MFCKLVYMIIFEIRKAFNMKISPLNFSASKINCSPTSLFVQKSASGRSIQIFSKVSDTIIEIIDEIVVKIS